MALMSIEDRPGFISDLYLVAVEVRAGVTEEYANRKDQHWDVW